MSKLREKLAFLTEAGIKEDVGEENFEKFQTRWKKFNPMTLFLMSDQPYYGRVFNSDNFEDVKKNFIAAFKEINDKYASDPEFSHWADTKVREMEYKVNQMRKIDGLIEYIKNSDWKGRSATGSLSDDLLETSFAYQQLYKLAKKFGA